METRAKENKQLRIWIAGCSTGQEAYSVAMIVAEYIQQQNLEVDVRILASDTKPAALAVARQGVYGECDFSFRSDRGVISLCTRCGEGNKAFCTAVVVTALQNRWECSYR